MHPLHPSTSHERPFRAVYIGFSQLLGFFVLFATWAGSPALAADPVAWGTSGGGMSNEVFRSVVTDEDGNIYVTGGFELNATFALNTVTSIGGEDILVAKYNRFGFLDWVISGGGASDDVARDIALDPEGNVIVIGDFSSPNMDLGGGVVSNVGGIDVFIAKFGPDGGHRWSWSFGGPGDDFGHSVATDEAGEIVATGSFEMMATFGGAALTSAGMEDIWFAKYDVDGIHIWSQRMGGALTDVGRAICVNSSNDLWITGNFNGVANFGGGAITSFGFDDVFLGHYESSAGAHLLSWHTGGAMVDIANGIACDSLDNILITGEFSGAVNFGTGALVSFGASDAFVAKYDGTSAPLWSRQMGGAGVDVGHDVTLDPDDSPVVAGEFENVADFAGEMLTSLGGSDAFLFKVTDTGAHKCAESAGSPLDDHGFGVSAPAIEENSLVGDFQNSLVANMFTLGSVGAFDAFLLHYGGGTVSAPSSPLAGRDPYLAAYPNPTRGSTTLEFQIASVTAATKLDVFDVSGRRVRTLLAGAATEAGRVEWDGTDTSGASVPAGVYWAKLHHGASSSTQRLVVLR